MRRRSRDEKRRPKLRAEDGKDILVREERERAYETTYERLNDFVLPQINLFLRAREALRSRFQDRNQLTYEEIEKALQEIAENFLREINEGPKWKELLWRDAPIKPQDRQDQAKLEEYRRRRLQALWESINHARSGILTKIAVYIGDEKLPTKARPQDASFTSYPPLESIGRLPDRDSIKDVSLSKEEMEAILNDYYQKTLKWLAGAHAVRYIQSHFQVNLDYYLSQIAPQESPDDIVTQILSEEASQRKVEIPKEEIKALYSKYGDELVNEIEEGKTFFSWDDINKLGERILNDLKDLARQSLYQSPTVFNQ